MKLNRYLKTTLGVIAAAFALICGTAAQGATFHVSIDTSALLSSPASASGPFYLDFQLNGGSTLSNTATISNFSFGGGSLSAGTDVAIGQTSGTLASTITLITGPSNPFNEFYQGFTAGSTLNFDVTHTTNVNVPVSDLFLFSILDSTLANISTNGFANSLVTLDINSVVPVAQAFNGTGDFSGVTAAVPEPSRALLMAVGIGAAGLRRRRRA